VYFITDDGTVTKAHLGTVYKEEYRL